MDLVATGSEGALLGLAVGALLGGGLFLLRRFAWSVALALGGIAAVALAGGILWMGSTLVLGSTRGGDGAMHAVMFLVAGGVALVGASAVIAFMAWSQCVRQGKPFWPSVLACIPDPVLVAASIGLVIAFVASPMERQSTETWWQEELARRKRVETMKNAIPEAYRNISSQQIDAHRRTQREWEKIGRQVPPLVPQDVENKIRNYEIEVSKLQPRADTSGYVRARKLRTEFTAALGISWLSCISILPFLARKRG